MHTNTGGRCLGTGGLLVCLAAQLACAQISVELTLNQSVYILGEAVRADVKIVNRATTAFLVGPGGNRQNGLTFEIRNARADAMESLHPRVPMIRELSLAGGESFQSAYELDEWYPLGQTGRYLVTALVRRDDMRYESSIRAIDVVPGLEIKTALQLFADRPDFQRKLTLVYYMRQQSEYLFLRVTDTPGDRTWTTIDLGRLLRTSQPSIEVAADGTVTIIHRATRDAYLKTRVRSTLQGVELLGQEQIVDQHAGEKAMAERMRAMEEGQKNQKKSSSWWWPF